MVWRHAIGTDTMVARPTGDCFSGLTGGQLDGHVDKPAAYGFLGIAIGKGEEFVFNFVGQALALPQANLADFGDVHAQDLAVCFVTGPFDQPAFFEFSNDQVHGLRRQLCDARQIGAGCTWVGIEQAEDDELRRRKTGHGKLRVERKTYGGLSLTQQKCDVPLVAAPAFAYGRG